MRCSELALLSRWLFPASAFPPAMQPARQLRDSLSLGSLPPFPSHV